MKLQQYLLNHYLHIPFEEFSHKAVYALGILVSIKNNPLSELQEKDKKKIDDAIKKVESIIDVTHEDIQVSLFILDRNIAPQDFSKEAVTHIVKFKRKRVVKGNDSISMSTDFLQKSLCEATKEIHTILMDVLAHFSEQMYFDENAF